MLTAFAVAFAVAALTPPAAAAATKIIAGPAGGHIVIARSAATTPLAALRDSGRAFGGYFGAAPRIESVAESTDGRAAYATFESSAAGSPAAGVIVAASIRGGTQLVALADRPDRLKTSFAPMLALLHRPAASGPAATSAEPLHPHEFPDRSGSVALPAGWVVQGAGQGQVQAKGPNGEAALLGIGPLIVDPRAGLQAQVAQQSGGFVLPYSADPRVVYTELQAVLARRAGGHPDVTFSYAKPVASNTMNAMVIRATESSKTGPETALGIIAVSPMTMGGYTLYIQIVTAPAALVERELPTLVAIFDSYHVNGAVRAQQVQATQRYAAAFSSAAIANIEATGAASIAAARASDAAMDRSTSGFVHYLNGTNVVENLGTGERGTVDDGFAQDLVRNDPQNFRVVPMSQYRAGE